MKTNSLLASAGLWANLAVFVHGSPLVVHNPATPSSAPAADPTQAFVKSDADGTARNAPKGKPSTDKPTCKPWSIAEELRWRITIGVSVPVGINGKPDDKLGTGDGRCKCSLGDASYIVKDIVTTDKKQDKCGYDKTKFLCALSPNVDLTDETGKKAWSLSGGEMFFNNLIQEKGVSDWGSRFLSSTASRSNDQTGTTDLDCGDILNPNKCPAMDREWCPKYKDIGAYYVRLQMSNYFSAMGELYNTQLKGAIGVIASDIKELIEKFGTPQEDQTAKVVNMILNGANMVTGIHDFINPAGAAKPLNLMMSLLSNSMGLFTNSKKPVPTKADIEWDAEKSYGTIFTNVQNRIVDAVANVYSGNFDGSNSDKVKKVQEVFGDGKFIDMGAATTAIKKWSEILSKRTMEAIMVQVMHTAKHDWRILVVPEQAPKWAQDTKYSFQFQGFKRMDQMGNGNTGGRDYVKESHPDFSKPMTKDQCGTWEGCVWSDNAVAGREKSVIPPPKHDKEFKPQGTAGCVCLATFHTKGENKQLHIAAGERLNAIKGKLVGDNDEQRTKMFKAALQNNAECKDDKKSAGDKLTEKGLDKGQAYPECFWNLKVVPQGWWTGIANSDKI